MFAIFSTLLIQSTTSNDEVDKNSDSLDVCNCEELCNAVIKSENNVKEEKTTTTTTTIMTTTTKKVNDDDDDDDDDYDSDESDEKKVKKKKQSQGVEEDEDRKVEEEEEKEDDGVICARNRDLVERNFSSSCHMKCFNRCTQFEIRNGTENVQIFKYVVAHRESEYIIFRKLIIVALIST